MAKRLAGRLPRIAGRSLTMENLHLFELIHAGPGLGPLQLGLAALFARWMIYALPLALAIAWLGCDTAARQELLCMLLATAVALALAQVVAQLWPQPRPFALHLGTQYLEHDNDPGLPSDHVTVIWSLALSALTTRRFALWGLPLLALGLVVGWSRVYLGVHFPFDVLAAWPVALAGTAISCALRSPLRPVFARIVSVYDRFAACLRAKLHPGRKA